MGRYNPKDAEGFINLFALPVTVRPKAKAEGNLNDGTQGRQTLGGALNANECAIRRVPALVLV